MTLPQLHDGRVWLCWTGLETDLIFNHGMDLPGSAAFPLLETEAGRQKLLDLALEQIGMARAAGCGVVLETPTWMANLDRAHDLGFSVEDLDRLNFDAAHQFSQFRGADVVLSGNIGPRGDGYGAGESDVEAARAYHARQIRAFATAGVDQVSAITLSSPEEAAGVALAAQAAGLPCAISFVVETNGRLADGMLLGDAIEETEWLSAGAPDYYMVNCAHPDHMAPIFAGTLPEKLRGVIANASRQSHAELDGCDALDDGDPAEFGAQLAALRVRWPQLAVLGGCCGTDMRHLRETAARSARVPADAGAT